MSRAEKRGALQATIGFLIVAIIAVCAAAVYSAKTEQHQEYASQKTPENEAKDVSVDREIADYTLWLTIFTGFLAISTIGLWFTTRSAAESQANDMKESVAAAKRSADLASESNELNRKIFIAGQRPWLLIDVQIGGPLHYNVNGANFTFDITITNNGRLPATNVDINLEVSAPAIGIESQDLVRPKRNAMITRAAHRKKESFGHTVFPGKPVKQTVSTSVSNAEIARITQMAQFIMPTVIGAVSYFFAGDDAAHQTSFVYDIVRSKRPRPESAAKNRSSSAIFPDEGDIPATDLVLLGSILIGDYAD